jgi:hypothetical protein
VEPALDDRRTAPRFCGPEDHGILLARVRPGHAAWIVDVSAAGALVETHHRLLPGTSIELSVQTSDRRAALRGRVVRCSVARVEASTIWYRGALDFDWPIAWLSRESPGCAIGPQVITTACAGEQVPGFPAPEAHEQRLPAPEVGFSEAGPP